MPSVLGSRRDYKSSRRALKVLPPGIVGACQRAYRLASSKVVNWTFAMQSPMLFLDILHVYYLSYIKWVSKDWRGVHYSKLLIWLIIPRVEEWESSPWIWKRGAKRIYLGIFVDRAISIYLTLRSHWDIRESSFTYYYVCYDPSSYRPNSIRPRWGIYIKENLL